MIEITPEAAAWTGVCRETEGRLLAHGFPPRREWPSRFAELWEGLECIEPQDAHELDILMNLFGALGGLLGEMQPVDGEGQAE